MFAIEMLNESMNGASGTGSHYYEPNMVGMMEIMSENDQDFFKLDTAIMMGANKVTALLAEGYNEEAEMLQENVITNVFDKIKELFKKMWNRLKEFFESVKLYFNKLFANETKFLNKYKDDINKISTIKIEGYDINVDGIKAKAAWGSVERLYNSADSNILADGVDIDKALEKDYIKSETRKNAVCMAAVGARNGKVKEAVYKKLGLDRKKNLSLSGSSIINMLEFKSVKSDVDRDEDEAKNAYDDAVELVNLLKNKLEDQKDNGSEDDNKLARKRITYVTSMLDGFKDGLDIINIIVAARVQANKVMAKQAKEAAYKGIAENRKEERKSSSGKTKLSDSYVDNLFAGL